MGENPVPAHGMEPTLGPPGSCKPPPGWHDAQPPSTANDGFPLPFVTKGGVRRVLRLTRPVVTPDLATRFLATARQFAERAALTYAEAGTWRSWSYRELADRAEALAAQLRELGVVAGDRVGIVAVRHPDTVALILGSLLAGAAYVPLDPRDPEVRIDQLARRADCRVLGRVDGRLRLSGRPGVGRGGEPVSVDPAERPAYVIYTSGSAGAPKGVVVPHRAVLHLVDDQDFLRFGPDRTFLQSIPLAFDASVLEVFGPLLHGGRCVLFPTDRLPNAQGLRQVVDEQQVTTACFTASLFHTLVDEAVDCLGSLEEVVVGGEALSVPHLRRALLALPRTRIVNGYGPTENGVQTTSYVVPRELPAELLRVPIGTPLRGTGAVVVDEHLRPLPAGQPGELFVFGDGLATGYWDAPDLTRAKFLTLQTEYGPLRGYRTGDRVVQLADGNFDFLGRLDQQIKLQGHRVHPSEPEQWIGSLDGVAQCCVTVCVDAQGANRLIAYVVLRAGETIARVAERTAAGLPSYLVPTRFVELQVLPLGANGKIDRAALPSPWQEVRPPVAKPAASLRRAVEAAWAEVLGRSVDAGDASFFDAGGRSLDAVRLHELLERVCGSQLEPTFVFEYPTRRRQAEALARRIAAGA